MSVGRITLLTISATRFFWPIQKDTGTQRKSIFPNILQSLQLVCKMIELS